MAGERTPSLVGRQFGTYRVVAPIAAGGMGEVFRARDEKLQRDVALKLLPSSFAADVDRVARFEREARLLAQLNHPHIAAIYGFVEGGPVRALLLELVDGPTLGERLAGGPLPSRVALQIASEIASALEAAHDRGIIHRDLKPANIKLTPEGTVKVLDFGIAKVVGDPTSSARNTQVDTVAPSDTQDGVVLGTSGYMSPEQLRGQPVDRRTDMWAFGCVLYEMLAGRPAFAAETSSDSVAAVLDREPDWSRLPTSTPPSIVRFLQRCLQKDPKQRFRDAGDARLVLNDALHSPLASPPTQSQRRQWSSTVAALALIAVPAVAAMTWWFAGSRRENPVAVVTRATFALHGAQELDTRGGAYPLAISRDGRRIVYGATDRGGAVQLYVREIGSFEARAIPGSDAARHPFFSPDAGSVAFFSDRTLKRVAIAGGAPVSISDVPPQSGNGTWGDDGLIVFDSGETGLFVVPAGGGSPTVLRTAEPRFDSRSIREPQFLPGRRTLLATASVNNTRTVVVLDIETGAVRTLLAGYQPVYVAPGFLVYHAPHVREGELHAVAFDIDQLVTRGSPFTVLDSVFRARAGGATYFAVSENGTIVFAPGGLAHTLVRVDRQGRRTPITPDRRGFRFPRLSPDGWQVAITIDPRPSQIWVYDLERSSGRPLATDGHSIGGAWRRDGQRYAYYSKGDIYWRASDGTGAEQRLLVRERNQFADDWTPDGSVLVFVDDHATTRADLWTLTPGGASRPLLVTPASENNPRLSHDGRWIAYTSDESGRPEVHVRPFPEVNDGKWVVSVAGGHSPAFAHSGRELFYTIGNVLMVVPIRTEGAKFVAGRPDPLFTGPFDTAQDRNFDVSPDGSFFVMVEADPDQRPTRLQVVLNWQQELRERAAATSVRR